MRACRPASRWIASDVRPLARASRKRPTRISTTITAADSKYTFTEPAGSTDGRKVATVEKPHAASVPTATSEFMSGAPRSSAGMPFR